MRIVADCLVILRLAQFLIETDGSAESARLVLTSDIENLLEFQLLALIKELRPGIAVFLE
jgi:hypothetical protein